MDILDIATLKENNEKVPEDFDVEFNDRNTTYQLQIKLRLM